LPAHQRVHLGVFIDGPLHAYEEAIVLQSSDVRVQVSIRAMFHASPHRLYEAALASDLSSAKTSQAVLAKPT
jgi:hypothetical protein